MSIENLIMENETRKPFDWDTIDVCERYKITICYRCTCTTGTYELGHSRSHAHTKERKVCLSRPPRTRISWFDFLHEVGHVVAEKADYTSGVPRSLAEYNATEWAKAYMKNMRLPIPRKTLREYNAYVTDKIARGLRRGLRRVPKELSHLKPKTSA